MGAELEPQGSDDSSLGLHGYRARADQTARKHSSAQTHGPETRPTDGKSEWGSANRHRKLGK